MDHKRLSQENFKFGMLVFYGCFNTLLQTRWLTTTGIYSLMVLEARRPNSVSLGWHQGIVRDVLPPEALGENLPWLFQFLMTTHIPWLGVTSLTSLPLCSSFFSISVSNLPLSPSMGVYPNYLELPLQLNILNHTGNVLFLPCKVTQILGTRTWISLRGHY